MNEFKKLLGESITDETAEALQQILESKLNPLVEAKQELEDEVKSLTEQVNVLNAEITEKENEIVEITAKADEFVEQENAELTEELSAKAEAYAEKIRQETIVEMNEQAEAEIATLMEKADKYGDFLQEQAEKYAEQEADKYGDFLQEKAEKYGTLLIEKAEKYGNSIEAKCLAEAKKEIDAFKEQHTELFEQVDEYNRMKMVFGNLKSLVESSGFSIDENSQLDALNSDLQKEKVANRKLKRKIDEYSEVIKEHKIKSIIEESSSDLTVIDKERVLAKAKGILAESDDELKQSIMLLIEHIESKAQQEKQEKQNSADEADDRSVSNWGAKFI